MKTRGFGTPMNAKKTGLTLPLPLQLLAAWLAVWLERVLQRQVVYFRQACVKSNCQWGYRPRALHEQQEDGHGKTSAASFGRSEAASGTDRAMAGDA